MPIAAPQIIPLQLGINRSNDLAATMMGCLAKLPLLLFLLLLGLLPFVTAFAPARARIWNSRQPTSVVGLSATFSANHEALPSLLLTAAKTTTTTTTDPQQQLQDLVASVTSGEFSVHDLQDGADRILEVANTAWGEFSSTVPLELRVALLIAPVLLYIAPWLQTSTNTKPDYATYPEQKPATYELSKVAIPFEFGKAAFVRPLLKQTQLEFRRLQVVYDAKRDGFNAQNFHRKVDGKGASVVLAKAGGNWFGGYNPR